MLCIKHWTGKNHISFDVIIETFYLQSESHFSFIDNIFSALLKTSKYLENNSPHMVPQKQLSERWDVQSLYILPVSEYLQKAQENQDPQQFTWKSALFKLVLLPFPPHIRMQSERWNSSGLYLSAKIHLKKLFIHLYTTGILNSIFNMAIFNMTGRRF